MQSIRYVNSTVRTRELSCKRWPGFQDRCHTVSSLALDRPPFSERSSWRPVREVNLGDKHTAFHFCRKKRCVYGNGRVTERICDPAPGDIPASDTRPRRKKTSFERRVHWNLRAAEEISAGGTTSPLGSRAGIIAFCPAGASAGPKFRRNASMSAPPRQPARAANTERPH
jgi:hypothetical protein